MWIFGPYGYSRIMASLESITYTYVYVQYELLAVAFCKSLAFMLLLWLLLSSPYCKKEVGIAI